MEKLSDFQLYSLVTNKDLDQDLKEKAIAEFERRNFSQEYIDQLSLESENIIPKSNADLTIRQKLGIVAFPFFIPIQAVMANRFISTGEPKKWRQYWSYLTLGWLVWTVIVLLIAKLFLKF